jgi:hypothetical protein
VSAFKKNIVPTPRMKGGKSSGHFPASLSDFRYRTVRCHLAFGFPEQPVE